ncbi:citrate synthase [Hypoxylon sp. FL1857]|nr:citrate synthase [Hypoxylon sp. FL1857]
MSNQVNPAGYLTVIDSRTKRDYRIPIVNNSVKASDFRQITSVDASTGAKSESESGLKIFDRGFVNTACVESSITKIDGENGRIHYRDMSIEHLFEHHDYEEVIHLLIWGHLPSVMEKSLLRRALATQMKPPQSVIDTIRTFPRDSPTFSMISGGLSAYAAVDEIPAKVRNQLQPIFLKNMPVVDAAIIRTIAIVATTVALVYCHKHGREFTPADPYGSYIANMLLMMGIAKDGVHDAEIERFVQRLWILHADHGITNSTAAFLHAASTLTDPLSCAISSLVSVYGPLHAGAIDLMFQQLEQIGTVDRVPAFVEAMKARKQRLFGFGHRIYKTVDPRATLIRQMLDSHLSGREQQQSSDKLRKNSSLLQIAREIDRVASSDSYFASRGLHANADLYGPLMYTALGFETDIIVAMAYLSRLPGMLAHWREEMQQPPVIWRPQQLDKQTTSKEGRGGQLGTNSRVGYPRL